MHPSKTSTPLADPDEDSLGRPQHMALPRAGEFWQLLQRYNQASLARRFPDWRFGPEPAFAARPGDAC